MQTHNFSSTDLGTFFIDHRFIDHKYHSSGNGQVRELDGKKSKKINKNKKISQRPEKISSEGPEKQNIKK